MRRIIFILFLNFISIIVNRQIPVQVESIYSFIKRNNNHRNNADWVSIDKGFQQKLALAKTDLDSIKCFIYVFEQFKDIHSSIT